ncbi:MAG: hypothetical protein KAS04_07370, partial [Candidatus Aenigmarchaeota archaeon]|nr:hypothetical protein [Candidatus Aenigmarchaeota archaeon]
MLKKFLMFMSGVLLLCAEASSVKDEVAMVKINGNNCGSALINKQEKKWEFDYKRSFATRPGSWLSKELGYAKGWKQHKKHKSICGYNGILNISIELPYCATKLEAGGEIVNYIDSQKRTACVEYSLNGLDYKVLGKKIEFKSGSVKISGTIDLPKNTARIWVRYGIKLKKGDSNGRSGYVLLKNFHFKLSGSPVKAKASIVPKITAPIQVPVALGVYLSWEIPERLAKANNVSLEKCLQNLLKLCKKRHVNTLWVTNINYKYLPFMQKLCKDVDIKLMVCSVDGKYPGYFNNNAAPIKRHIDQMVKSANGDDTLVGWVLSDEPKRKTFKNLKIYHELLKKKDPYRFTATVGMWPDAHFVPGETPIQAVAVDLYPFFGPNDPNGPHTDRTSKKFFTRNIMKLVAACEGTSTIPWVMGQCFVEIWGPYEYNEQGQLIALPGSYLHWRSPTVAEMRWQIFESFRLGARGTFIFQLCPVMKYSYSPKIGKNFKWKSALLKERTNAGYAALSTPKGKTTPQFDELGRVYKSLSPLLPIIKRWKKLSA